MANTAATTSSLAMATTTAPKALRATPAELRNAMAVPSGISSEVVKTRRTGTPRRSSQPLRKPPTVPTSETPPVRVPASAVETDSSSCR